MLRPRQPSRFQLYKMFVWQIIQREAAKLRSKSTSAAADGDTFELDTLEYSRQLAIAMTRAGVVKCAYQERSKIVKSAGEWDRFFGNDEALAAVRSAHAASTNTVFLAAVSIASSTFTTFS